MRQDSNKLEKGTPIGKKWTFGCLFGSVLSCLLLGVGWWVTNSLKPCHSLDILFALSGCKEITQLSGTDLLKLSQDGSVLAAYIEMNRVEFLDLKTGELKTILGNDAEIWAGAGEYDIALNFDGSYAAVIGIGSVTGEPQLGLVDTSLANPLLQIISLPIGQLATRAAFSPDDEVLAVAIDANPDYVAFFNYPDGEQTGRLDFSGDNIVVAYLPNGHLATAFDGKIQIWDVKEKSIEKTIESELSNVSSMVFSGDGSLVAVTSGDRYGFGTMAVDVYRLNDGQRLYTFSANKTYVAFNGFPATFSPDGKLLVASSCYIADVYRLEDGKLETTLSTHWDNRPFGGFGTCLSAVQFASDGQSVYYGWIDGGVVRWRLP